MQCTPNSINCGEIFQLMKSTNLADLQHFFSASFRKWSFVCVFARAFVLNWTTGDLEKSAFRISAGGHARMHFCVYIVYSLQTIGILQFCFLPSFWIVYVCARARSFCALIFFLGFFFHISKWISFFFVSELEAAAHV